MDIIAAYREVGSYRGAAELCGTTPKTVRRVIQRHEAGGQRPQRNPRARNYDRMVELVHSRVQATRGRMSDKRLLPAARTAGYPGSPRTSVGWSRRRSAPGMLSTTAAAAAATTATMASIRPASRHASTARASR
jgi:hypothetical protein